MKTLQKVELFYRQHKKYLPHRGHLWYAYSHNGYKKLYFTPFQIFGGQHWSLCIIKVNTIVNNKEDN